MKGFFLPWNEREKQVKWGEKKLYLPKETLSLTDAAFDTHKPALCFPAKPKRDTPFFFAGGGKRKKGRSYGLFFRKSR